ncbi:hypothetical protein K490DRAFT_65158 [Saccharata proteae CBS 121410]|uniref:Uncharacterized protein n=1 Tax=Saccharata proteae CBS 121410 TaxID=1314787 RepID=A0A9P4HTR8_9PEZI|nr:hypothetical protein K490DRAFT_65158 [Saccharata proteae CBS 121410]
MAAVLATFSPRRWQTLTAPLAIPQLPKRPTHPPKRPTTMQRNQDLAAASAPNPAADPHWQRKAVGRLVTGYLRGKDPIVPAPWYPVGKSWKEERAAVYGVDKEEEGDGDTAQGEALAASFHNISLQSRSPSPKVLEEEEEEDWVELSVSDAPATSMRDRKRGGYGDGRSKKDGPGKASPGNTSNPDTNTNALREWGFSDHALAAARRAAAGEDIDPYTLLPRESQRHRQRQRQRRPWFGRKT